MTVSCEPEFDLVYRAPIVERLQQMISAVAVVESVDGDEDSCKAGLLVGLAMALDLIKGLPAATLSVDGRPQVKRENPQKTTSEGICGGAEPVGMTRPGDVIHDC